MNKKLNFFLSLFSALIISLVVFSSPNLNYEVHGQTLNATATPLARPPTDDSYKISLQSREFTPQAGIEPALAQGHLGVTGVEAGRIHVLLQLHEPPTTEIQETLRTSGIELLNYIPRNTWFASIPAAANQISALGSSPAADAFRWMGTIQPEDKVHPKVWAGQVGTWAVAEDGRVRLAASFFEDVTMDTAREVISRRGGEVEGEMLSSNKLLILLPLSQIATLAAEDTLRWLDQIPPPPVENNDGARNAANVNTIQFAPYNLTGEDVDIGIWDGGLVDRNHEDFQNNGTFRVTQVDSADISDHATHVAGTMAGNGARSEAQQFRGVAPEADIISYDFNDPINEYDDAINTRGIELSNNSWGRTVREIWDNCDDYGDYRFDAPEFDRIVRGQHGRRIPIIFAATNERDDGDCGMTGPPDYLNYGNITPPNTAKNIVTIGAINSDDDTITDFSSWGPVDDGRLKPEVVAPGGQTGNAGIVSTMPNSVFSDDFINGTCPFQIGSDGIDDFFPPYTNSNGPANEVPACEDIWEGTSMAAPVVSGISALLIEQYRDIYDRDDPWPSSVKALLVHAAHDLDDGTDWYNPGPDYASGYGAVDGKDSVDLVRGRDVRQDTISADDEVDEFRVWVPAGTNTLKVTLAWDDPQGTENANPALVNDLDLFLVDSNNSLHNAWVLDQTQPASNATTGWNDTDNLEQVVVNNPSPGEWKIRVRGRDVQQAPQDYSIVTESFFDILRPDNIYPAYAGSNSNPNKIIAKITKPANGLTKDDFSITIGSQSATILTAYEGSEEYVLEINPPNQSADGLYDLTVSVGSSAVTDTEPNAVQYTDANNVDTVLVLDRSGSMYSYGYLEPAKDAAKQFVDFMHDNDKIGVVSFDNSATVNFGLTTISSGSGGAAFSDDMESGNGQWTADSPWAQITSDYHSATHSWTDSPGGNYSNYADVSLTSISFDLSSITNPSLQFWTHYAFESCCDHGYVEISTNGGSSWTTLATYNGTNTTWTEDVVSLEAYAGQTSVQIRFRLYSDYSVTYDGWYIDDVAVIPGSTKEEAKNAIADIYSGGSTSIGDGLQDGQNELTTKGEATHPWAIVLLSDGYENYSPYVADVLPGIKSTKTIVHTIALGQSSDEALLMDIAAQTGGTYNLAPTADQLAAIYNTIAGAVSGQQTLFSETGLAQQGVTEEKNVVVDSTVSEATFSVSWSNGSNTIDLTLEKPNGSSIGPAEAAADPNVEYVSGSTYAYYRVKTPTLAAGVWKMKITGGSITTADKGIVIADTGEPYTAIVNGQSGLTMNSYLDKDSYLTTEPIKVSATLADHQPILGASVTVNVEPPDQTSALLKATDWIEVNGDTMPEPTTVAEIQVSEVDAATTLTLHDDGAHGDGQAGDGVYANSLTAFQTQIDGTYTFRVSATGNSNNGDPFSRQSQFIVFVDVNPGSNIQSVFLPSVLKDYTLLSDTYEPNDTPETSYGPLSPGNTYQSYIWTFDDYDGYYINVTTLDPIIIDLTNIPAGNDYDLDLFDENVNYLDGSYNGGNLSEYLYFTPPSTGKYYVLVYSFEGYSTTQPYHLRVGFNGVTSLQEPSPESSDEGDNLQKEKRRLPSAWRSD